GGLFGFKFSSRPHPRKFGQKRFLAVRRSWRGNGVACFWLTSLEEIIGGARDHLDPPRGMDAAICCAEVCYPFGRKRRRYWAVKGREFITLLGGAAAASIGVAALAAIFTGALPVAAQDYPARPITLVVPFPAGGGNDTLARVVAEKMSR